MSMPALNEPTERFTCIVCPLGCALTVTGHPGTPPEVTGNRCRRGIEYGRAEVSDPRRTLTTTVTLTGAELRRLPVKTAAPIPRDLLRPAAAELRKVSVAPPVRTGQVIVTVGTGTAVVATRDVADMAGGCQFREENS